MPALLRPLRLATRALTRAPGFAVTAIVTLGLGIGLATAVFTVAQALLFRNLPVDDQDRVVTLWGQTRAGGWSNLPLSLEQTREFARGARTLREVAFFTFRGATPTPAAFGDRTIPLRTALVSGNFFAVLGTRAAVGRALRPDDDEIGAAPVVVLSHRAWQRRFGGDSTVIGRPLTSLQSGRAATIVGVMPRGLEYPRGTEVWAPVVATSAAAGYLAAATGELDLLARLRPDATPNAAAAELTGFFGRPETPTWQREARGVATPLARAILGDTRPALVVVALAAVLLLLITCVNVANLLLVRALGRSRELAVRAALGASRGRLVAEQLLESALLSTAGGILGVGLAAGAVTAFVALAPESVPRLDEVGLDGRILGLALLVTAATVVLAGLGPTLFSVGPGAEPALRAGPRATGGRRARRVAEALVVTQIALAAVCLSAAGLMVRSLVNLTGADLSFRADDLVVAELAWRQDRLTAPGQAHAALEQLRGRLEAAPGIRAVSPVVSVPFVAAGGGIDGAVGLEGQTREETAANPISNFEVVAPNYFATLGIPVRGRAFDDRDRRGPPVVILSQSVARHFWPNADPLGQRVLAAGATATVVGVVPDTRYRDLVSARPSVYFPLGSAGIGSIVPSTLVIRTADGPAAVAPLLRRIGAELGGGMAVVTVTRLDALLDGPRAQPRLHAAVLVGFAVAAVALAAVGLFAIIATMVRQRTRELAIRLALGATGRELRRMVLIRGLVLAAGGALVGLAGAVATSGLVAGLLFEVEPTDPVTLMAVLGFLLLAAGVASYLPARTGSRIHPATVLRLD